MMMITKREFVEVTQHRCGAGDERDEEDDDDDSSSSMIVLR